MRALSLRLILPLLILLALEFAFRAGVWDGLTSKNSNAGKAVRVTRGLSNWPEKIDFVTIGDSRAKRGLDHQWIAETAGSFGYTHVKLTIPGSHLLVESLLIEWLRSEHSDLQGGIIATSVSSLLYPQSGDYELAMAQPLSKIFHREHILLERFNPARPSTWGAVSSLYSYREDIQDFVKAHKMRLEELKKENYSDKQQLFSSDPATLVVPRGSQTQRGSFCSQNTFSWTASHIGRPASAVSVRKMGKTASCSAHARQPSLVSGAGA